MIFVRGMAMRKTSCTLYVLPAPSAMTVCMASCPSAPGITPSTAKVASISIVLGSMNGMDGEGEGSGEGSGEEESLRPWERAPPTESLAETDTTRASAPESLGASTGEGTGKGRSSGCVIHACAPCRTGALSRTASVPSTASNAADQMVENLLLGDDASNFALPLPFASSRMSLAFAVCKTHRPRKRYRSVRTAFDHERLRCTPFKDLDAQPLHFGRSTAGDVGDEATSAGGVEPAMPVATNTALRLAGVELPSGGGWRHQNRGAGVPCLAA